MKRKRHIDIQRVVTISLTLVLLASILLFSIPIPIDTKIEAIEIKLDEPSYIHECSITINGAYNLNLFTDDTFSGTIAVSSYDQTLEKMSTVYFSKDGCPLYYHRFEEGSYNEAGQPIRYEYSLGKMMSGRLFRNMIIAVYSENPLNKDGGWKEGGSWETWNERDGYCIVTDVHSYEEAISRVAQFSD